MEQMQKALVLDPLSIVINTNVATFLSSFGNFDEAMALFDKIIEIDLTAAQGYLGKARLHWSVYGRLDEAEPFVRKALSLDPNSPQYHAMLGALYLTLGYDRRAECVVNMAMRFGPETLFPSIMMAYLHAYRNDFKQALSYARISHKMDPNKGDVLLFIRDAYLQEGKYDQARSLYVESTPALMNDDDPVINKKNYRNAIDLAYVLQLNDEKGRAERLLERSLAFIRSGIHRLDFDGYKINDVRIYALQGEKQQALNALRQAINEGWRDGWWYFLEIDPGLQSIRDEPDFQAMLAEVKADMAEQLARVKAAEKEGDVCVNP
jgi:tetratricopeptide (TPR) repeat protein